MLSPQDWVMYQLILQFSINKTPYIVMSNYATQEQVFEFVMSKFHDVVPICSAMTIASEEVWDMCEERAANAGVTIIEGED